MMVTRLNAGDHRFVPHNHTFLDSKAEAQISGQPSGELLKPYR
jgi:hypothetical protein